MRRARAAITVVFVVHGLLFASWTAHVPEVKEHLGVSDAVLGLALLGAPVGAVSATMLTGVVLARVDSRHVLRVTASCYALSGALVGQAGSLPALFAALALWGFAQGATDVAMNTQGIAVEQAMGVPVMPGLHGGWSLGALAGAGIGVAGVATGTSLTVQMLCLGVPALVLLLAMTFRLVDEPEREAASTSGRRRVPGVLVVFGVVAFAGLLCEGAAADWSAVYLRDALHATPAVAGLGYTAFAMAMALVRLSGTRLLTVVRPRRLVACLAGVAALAMTTGLLVAGPAVAITGFALLGAGLGSIVPLLFSAAGNQPGVAPGAGVATVAAIGWVGFLGGPPLIGFLAGHLSLPFALGLVPVLTAAIGLVTWQLPALDRAASPAITRG